MKTIYIISLTFFVIASTPILIAQPTDEGRLLKEQLLSLEHQWLSAELRSDTLFISSLLDSGFIGISEYGVHSKSQELTDMLNTMEERRKNNIHIDTFVIQDEVVNLYHNMAVVTFILHTYRNENGLLTQRKTRFYDVWVKKGELWLAVSSQGSIVKE